MVGKARLVADALAKAPPLLPLPDDEDMRVTFEVFVSLLRMVAVEDPPSLPFGVVLGFMSMEALPSAKTVGKNIDGVITEIVYPLNIGGKCPYTRVIRTGPSPATRI